MNYHYARINFSATFCVSPMCLSKKAGGRGQEAGGKLPSVSGGDQREQGFKTPTKFKIW
jgi:hypothetical protein